MSIKVFFAVSLGPAYTTLFDSFFGNALPSLKITLHQKIDGWETWDGLFSGAIFASRSLSV